MSTLTQNSSHTYFLALIDAISLSPKKRDALFSTLVNFSLNSKTSKELLETKNQGVFLQLCELFQHLSPQEQKFLSFSVVYPFLNKSLSHGAYTGQEVAQILKTYAFLMPNTKEQLTLEKFLHEKKPKDYQVLLDFMQKQEKKDAWVIHGVIDKIRTQSSISLEDIEKLREECETMRAVRHKGVITTAQQKTEYLLQIKATIQNLVFYPHEQGAQVLKALNQHIKNLFDEIHKQKLQTVQEKFPIFLQQYDLSDYFKTVSFSQFVNPQNLQTRNDEDAVLSYLELPMKYYFSKDFDRNVKTKLKKYNLEDLEISLHMADAYAFFEKPKKWGSKAHQAFVADVGILINNLYYGFHWDFHVIENYLSPLEPQIKKHFSQKDLLNQNKNISALSAYFNEAHPLLGTNPSNDDRIALSHVKIEFEKYMLGKQLSKKPNEVPHKKFKI